MKKENKELLESLIQNRLEEALRNEDENSRAFEEAMEAIDRQIQLDNEDNEGIKITRDQVIKMIEIGAMLIVAPLIDARCKRTFARMLCEFEKDYNFTTMAGKSLSGLFKFRR